MAEIELRDVSKSYDGRARAVDGVSLAVPDGKTLTVLGPSGCGKSTLLRLVAGLERPDSGEVRIGGERVNERDPARRDIAMVFQSYALYPHMTVIENISISLRLRGVPRDEIDRRVRETAAMLGIEGLLMRRPRELSGGERQRVAVARAIVRRPAAFLLDEPLSNLDAVLRERTRSELKALFQKLGGTVVYVTHDQLEAMTLSDRVAVMRQGRIEQLGTPDEIYRRPASIFVAGFVGSPRMNLLRRGAGTLGIRPEDVVVGSGDRTMQVALREPLGPQQLLTLRDGEEEIRALVSAEWTPVDRVPVTLPPERTHRFDAEGRRVAS